MGHKICHKTKCKYHPPSAKKRDKIIISGNPPKIAFCEQIRAFPIGHRKCV